MIESDNPHYLASVILGLKGEYWNFITDYQDIHSY
jgi:hypothetical protein